MLKELAALWHLGVGTSQGRSANPRVSSWIQRWLEAVGAADGPLVLQEGCEQRNQMMILLRAPDSGCSGGSGSGLEEGSWDLVHPV